MLPYIVAAAYFMEYLDTTVISTALPQMARSFSVTPNEVSLGMTAYMLTLAVFIPISGWIADRFGSRTVFGAALGVFTVAPVLCCFSTDRRPFTRGRSESRFHTMTASPSQIFRREVAGWIV